MRKWILVLIVAAQASTTASAQSLIATKAPELRLAKLVQGPSVQALRGSLKGKLVILEFWATWCAPCVAAIPHLNELAGRLPQTNTAFIAITKEPDERVTRFLAKHTMNAWVALDLEGATTKAFNIQVLPTSVVIAPSGKVVLVTNSPERLTEQELLRLLHGNTVPKIAGPQKAEQPRSLTAPAPEPLLQIELSRVAGSEPVYSVNAAKGVLVGDAIDVRSLLGIAHNLPAVRVIGPAGLLNQYLSVKFRVPPGHDLLATIRDALTVAFSLSTRREVRDIPVYRLRVSSVAAHGLKPNSGKEASHLSDAPGVIIGANWDFASLPAELEDVLTVPVLNETNLSGKYDWDLSYEPGNQESLVTAVQDQLGLELVKSAARVEVLVVEVGNTTH